MTARISLILGKVRGHRPRLQLLRSTFSAACQGGVVRLWNKTMKLQASAETVWKMSLPLVLCGLGDTIVEVTDTILLARFGVTELGAVALAAAIYESAIFVMFGVSDGIQIITARRAGQARDKSIGEAFRYGMMTLLAVGFVV